MNDNSRDGANLGETVLTTANVNAKTFGKLWSYTVDGATYAQTLYVSGLPISGGAHNVIYVATMNDSVYAFDADSNSAFWHVSFTGGKITPVPIADITGSNTFNIVGNVGVESTPVIDRASGTIYLVARTKDTSNSSYHQKLHALDLATGAEKFGGPVTISAPGFDPKLQNQRASLALANGKVIICWASHEDITPYHGWVMAYLANNLHQSSVFNTTPTGTQGSIWQSGRAPAVDSSGQIYIMSSNGTWDGVRNFSDSFLKLSTTGNLTLTDWFTPDNHTTPSESDSDVGSSGPMLIPGTSLMVGGGKEGFFFLINTGKLGHEVAGNGQIVQSFQATSGFSGMIRGGPVYWKSPNHGPLIYNWASGDQLDAFSFNGSKINPIPVAKSVVTSPGLPGAFLSVSANGSTAGTGIVWAFMPSLVDNNWGTAAGILRAFDASNVAIELWNSEQNSARDTTGNFVKDAPPTVVNGRVYVGSYSNKVNVYGELAIAVTAPVFSPGAGRYSAAQSVTITSATSGASIRYTTDGSTPTPTSGTVYSGPVRISVTTTLKAIAYKNGMTNSTVASAAYIISSGGATVYQAETGSISGGVLNESANAGFTGTGYADTTNVLGAWWEITVNVPTAGTYSLDFRYANGTSTVRPADLSINGTMVQAGVAFPGTGAWTTWGDVIVTKTLNAGNNKVRLTAATANGNANLDKLTVQ